MFRAIKRVIRAIGYLLVGKLDKAADALYTNPDAMRGGYQKVIEEKTKHAQEYMDAVASKVESKNEKMARLERLNADATKLSDIINGAKVKAKERAEALGFDEEALRTDEKYQELRQAAIDRSHTLVEKQERIADLEDAIRKDEVEINNHKARLRQMKTDVQKLKDESKDAVADVRAAAFDQKINDTLNGISDDKTENDLTRLREARNKAAAKASISSEMAGTDVAALEMELMAAGKADEATADFDSFIFKGQKKQAPAEKLDLGAAEAEVSVGEKDKS